MISALYSAKTFPIRHYQKLLITQKYVHCFESLIRSPFKLIDREIDERYFFKVFMLKMERTGLHYLQPNFLQGTGSFTLSL